MHDKIIFIEKSRIVNINVRHLMINFVMFLIFYITDTIKFTIAIICPMIDTHPPYVCIMLSQLAIQKSLLMKK